MSKQHRTKHIKSLEEQLAATTDPQLKADISRQLTKLLSKSTRKGSPRKSEVTPADAPKGKTSALVDKWANRLSHVVPYEKRILESVILEAEEKAKSRGISFHPPCIESRALMAEVMGMLSEGERAMLEAYEADEAQAAERAKRVEGLKGC